MIYRELLLGCGSDKRKKVWPVSKEISMDWTNVTTLDFAAVHKPDVLHDLRIKPWPFDDNIFDEVHAYEVLEHLGQQGDFISFFSDFYEIWRILKQGGILYATCPMWNGSWAWGDPGHTRIISSNSLVFLSQAVYARDVGKTAMSDYREYWKGDFEILGLTEQPENLIFALQAIKHRSKT